MAGGLEGHGRPVNHLNHLILDRCLNLLNEIWITQSLFVFITDFNKPIPNSTSGVEECPYDRPYLCKESHQCISDDFVCDGHMQCDKGEDESLELCKKRNAFAKTATIECDAKSDGTTNLTLRILSFHCNGVTECQGGIDELDCDIAIKYLIVSLAIGFSILNLIAGIDYYCFQRSRNIAREAVELEKLIQKAPTEEEWHQDENRGQKIAFDQGSIHRIQKNRALVASEIDFHGSLPEAISCINVSTIFLFTLNF